MIFLPINIKFTRIYLNKYHAEGDYVMLFNLLLPWLSASTIAGYSYDLAIVASAPLASVRFLGIVQDRKAGGVGTTQDT